MKNATGVCGGAMTRARRPLCHRGLVVFAGMSVGLMGCESSASRPAGIAIVPAPELAGDTRWPVPTMRLPVQDHGVVMRHGDGPDRCDYLGARDVWVWEHRGTYYMHYDGAGPKGWLVCLATSKDLTHWDKKGAVIDLGPPGSEDSATASYGTTYFDGRKWHMFYLGSPQASDPPDRVPIGPYFTMKAEADSPAGPWRKRSDFVTLRPSDETGANASPGHVIRSGDEYLMFFSGLGVARAKDLDGPWTIDKSVVFPPERCENASLYYESTNRTWFLFTNHIGDGYTDAIWVYWTTDLNRWEAKNKAVVLDGQTCSWSKTIVGLPSVLRVGNRLAMFYDGNKDPNDKWHIKRDVGLAWIDRPIRLPRE